MHSLSRDQELPSKMLFLVPRYIFSEMQSIISIEYLILIIKNYNENFHLHCENAKHTSVSAFSASSSIFFFLLKKPIFIKPRINNISNATPRITESAIIHTAIRWAIGEPKNVVATRTVSGLWSSFWVILR